MKSRKHKLIEIHRPEFGTFNRPEMGTSEDFESRIRKKREKMDQEGLTHLVIYVDRKNFANLAWITGFDPLFEEALLIMDLKHKPLILFGNDCQERLNISPLHVSERLRSERYQPFSLLDQPKNNSRFLRDIFDGELIGGQSLVGCVGWKYFDNLEQRGADHTIEIPAFIEDTLRELAGRERVINSTTLFMNPDTSMRTFVLASDIGYFEFTGSLASEGMKNMLFYLEEGMTDYELARYSLYNGEPQGAHFTMKTIGNQRIRHAGPMGTEIHRGDPFSSNICYWDSNSCRAGWVARSKADISPEAQDYIPNFAGPYFEAMGQWFSFMKIGIAGGKIAFLMEELLPHHKYDIFLNPASIFALEN